MKKFIVILSLFMATCAFGNDEQAAELNEEAFGPKSCNCHFGSNPNNFCAFSINNPFMMSCVSLCQMNCHLHCSISACSGSQDDGGNPN